MKAKKQESSNPSSNVIHAGSISLLKPPQFFLRIARINGYDHYYENVTCRRNLDYEWIIQIRGDSWLTVPEHKAMILIPEGAIALVPPNFWHGQALSKSEHLAIHFDFEAKPDLVFPNMTINDGVFESTQPLIKSAKLQVKGPEEHFSIPLVQNLNAKEWLRIAMPLVKASALGQQNNTKVHLQASSILSEFALKFIESGKLNEKGNKLDILSHWLSEIDIFNHSLSIQSLADQCGMSATSFRESMKQLTGKSPHDWLEDRRCKQAKMLLVNSPMSVKDISQSCGYMDPYHFSRVFKGNSSMSPKKYREKSIREGTFKGGIIGGNASYVLERSLIDGERVKQFAE